jgi:hypothetical protein
MSSPIRPAKDFDAALMYAPPWAREKHPGVLVIPADKRPTGQPLQSLRADPAGPRFSGDIASHLRHRSSLDPKLVLQPTPLEGYRTGATALRLTGVTALAAIVAWVVVSLPGVGQRSGNNNIYTAVLPNPGSGTARPPANAIAAAPAASPTMSQSAKITSRPDDEETSALIKLGQDFLKNGEFSSGRLLLKRAANAGSAAAALLLGETFDPFLVQRFGVLGVQPDVAEAREWYQRAAQLGSSTAAQHLATLADDFDFSADVGIAAPR